MTLLSLTYYALPFATGAARGLQQRARARAERKATDAYLQKLLAEAAPLSWGSHSSTATLPADLASRRTGAKRRRPTPRQVSQLKQAEEALRFQAELLDAAGQAIAPDSRARRSAIRWLSDDPVFTARISVRARPRPRLSPSKAARRQGCGVL